MATSIYDIRFISERNIQDQLDDIFVLNACNGAQTDFMLRIFIPDTTTLTLDTTTVSYSITAEIREIRRMRYQSDLNNKLNIPVTPVYTLYNGLFEVPYPFPRVDTLLIDYYRYMTFFTSNNDVIDLQDRFYPLYTSYLEMQYYRLPSTVEKLGVTQTESKYQSAFSMYQMMKKQVTSAYNLDVGVQKPKESGWGNK